MLKIETGKHIEERKLRLTRKTKDMTELYKDRQDPHKEG